MELLKDVTANETGEWFTVGSGRDYVLAISSTADFGGGTLDIEFRDRDTETMLTGDTSNLQFTAAFAPTGVVVGSGMQVRAKLSGATSPDITGVFLYSTDE